MVQFNQLAAVDLNLLVALEALLTEQNVTRAGERLSLSQPAMSAALKRLREQFGDELLVRSGQRMEATEFARSLRGPLREALEQLAATIAARPLFDPKSDRRHFRLFANDYVGAVLLAPLVKRLIDRAPGVSIEAITASRRLDPHLLDTYLHDERLDLVIAAGDLVAADRFRSAPLFDDRFVCAVGTQAAGIRKRLTRSQLATLPYLAYRQGDARSFADEELDRMKLPRRTVLTVESFVLVPHLIRHSKMVTMIQRRLSDALSLDGIRIVEPPLRMPPISERMYWHQRSESDPAHAWLQDQLQTVAAELPPL
ncbi:MAG TPA: LysR family transcriptional regulator [Solirubrobacteraceae bacterium]|jgi:DNA-binding transcriptional LysR family regulator|nr:LysR family transcriptional regulator [Solirubrobacteraceae bacterium]